MDHTPFRAVRAASGTTKARVLLQLRLRRRFLGRFYDLTVNMQSKWPPRPKNPTKHSVFERPKMQKIHAEMLRMPVKRRFCMLNLLWR